MTKKIRDFYESRASIRQKIFQKKWLHYIFAYDDRYENVNILLRKLLSGRERLKILDLGCGDGVYESMLPASILKSNFFYGADISKKKIGKSKRYFEKIVNIDFDDGRLPFDDSSFDIVICSEVLEHLFFPDQLAKQIIKLLKKDGKVLVTVPNSGSLSLRLQLFFLGRARGINFFVGNRVNPHIRFFSKRDLLKLFFPLNLIQYKGTGSLAFHKWNFGVQIPLPRFLQLFFNRVFPTLALGNLYIFRK